MTTYSPLTIEALAMAGGFVPGKQLTEAVATALATSGGDPSYNSGGRIGLWGLTAGTAGYTAAQLATPAVNALAAHSVFSGDGNQFTAAHWPAWASGAAQKQVTALGNNWTFNPNPNPSTGSGGSGSGGGGGDVWSEIGNGLAADGVTPLGLATGGLSNIPGAISGVVPGLSGVDAIAGELDKAASWITTPSNWVHVAYVIGGGALILVGLIVLARPAVNSAAGAVTKVATGATPLGRATKAVGAVQKRRAAAARAGQQRTAREAERTRTRARTQQRIEERHTMAKAREQRAAERHASRKPKKESSSDGD